MSREVWNIYIPPGDVNELTNKLIYLSKNYDRRAEPINNSFKIFENYNWNEQGIKYLEIMRELIGNE